MFNKYAVFLLLFSLPLRADMGADEASEKSFRVTLSPFYQTELSSEIESQVIKVHKHMGSSFEKGEILIELDDELAVANYKKAKAGFALAKAERTAYRKLYKEGASSSMQLKEVELRFASSQAYLKKMEKEYRACSLRAPYAGKVERLFVDPYERVEGGDLLMEIVDDHKLLLQIIIPSSMLKDVFIGQKLKISLSDVLGSLEAKLTQISPVIDPSSSMLRLRGELENKEGTLRAGMTGFVSFVSKGK